MKASFGKFYDEFCIYGELAFRTTIPSKKLGTVYNYHQEQPSKKQPPAATTIYIRPLLGPVVQPFPVSLFPLLRSDYLPGTRGTTSGIGKFWSCLGANLHVGGLQYVTQPKNSFLHDRYRTILGCFCMVCCDCLYNLSHYVIGSIIANMLKKGCIFHLPGPTPMAWPPDRHAQTQLRRSCGTSIIYCMLIYVLHIYI